MDFAGRKARASNAMWYEFNLPHHPLHERGHKIAHALEDALPNTTRLKYRGAVAQALQDVVADGFLVAVDVRFHEG